MANVIIYNEATIFNANIELLNPKKVKVTMETSGSPSCWTNHGPSEYSGTCWTKEFIEELRKEVSYEENLKRVSGPYGSDYDFEVVLIF